MIRVLGLGNVLMSDDGFGPSSSACSTPTTSAADGVEFVDVGTPGLDLTPYLLGADAVIFVDTVTSTRRAGEIRVYERDDILSTRRRRRTGPHDPALKEALLRRRRAGRRRRETSRWSASIPQWMATGVTCRRGPGRRRPRAVRAVVDALTRLGTPPRRRSRPLTPDVWWCAADECSAPACGVVRTRPRFPA